MIDKNDRIVVAVSGGADSIFMLYNLCEIKDDYNLQIIVAHVNHGVRESASRDEEFVEKVCKKLGVEFFLKKVDMNAYAKENKMTSEEAGRFLRYEFFRNLSKNEDKIFLAHNANDQAETVLQRIIRGTGIEGLGAMDYVKGDLYRPMLNIKREEIIDYINTNKINFVDDETNRMDIYGRNKVRLNIIPYIEDNFNQNFIDSLIRLSDISKGNQGFINSLVNEYLDSNYNNNVLKIKKLRHENNYFISEVVRKFVKLELKTLEGVSQKNISDILYMINNNISSKVTLPQNRNIGISYDSLYIEDKFKNNILEPIVLKYGLNQTPFGNIIISEVKDFYYSDDSISIDKDKIKGKLIIRNRRAGDKFIPLGMTRSKKIKDFFIDEKISRNLRDRIPLICDDEEIIWVAPYRMSSGYKTDKNTKHIINIKLEENFE